MPLTQATIAERILVLFVRHALLVRPLTEMAKMRLIRDMTKLEEVAVMLLCFSGHMK
jgi:hypothetical protein